MPGLFRVTAVTNTAVVGRLLLRDGRECPIVWKHSEDLISISRQLLTKTKAVIDITGISRATFLSAMLRLNPIPQAA